MVYIPDDVLKIIQTIVPEVEKNKQPIFEQEQLVLELPLEEYRPVEKEKSSKIEIQL